MDFRDKVGSAFQTGIKNYTKAIEAIEKGAVKDTLEQAPSKNRVEDFER